jgi:glycosyltransferase involved in cell wall biosynthesis
MIPISVVIIAKNEAHTIADCIASAKSAQEIIVIDALSADATADIARNLGATVVVQEWQGYGLQKNFGAQQAHNNWVLFLDADERISPELEKKIAEIISNATQNVFWVTIEDIFLHKRMKHLAGHNPRLIQRANAHWNTAHVHEKMVYTKSNAIAQYKDGISGEITEPIIHESYSSIDAYLKKMHRYTTLDAQEMSKANKHRSGKSVSKSALLPYYLALKQFIKLYFYRGGFFDSWQGLVWCVLSAYYEFEMGQKYLAL